MSISHLYVKSTSIWIEKEEKKISVLDSEYVETAQRHIKNCRFSLNRMRKGLEMIQQDQKVFEAFRFANQAMSLQIEHSVWAKKKEKNWSKGPDEIETLWRPFQIAFFLQGLVRNCVP